MNNAFVILTYFLLSFSCNNSKQFTSDPGRITKAFIKSNIPIVGPNNNSIINYPDSVVLFSTGDYSVLFYSKIMRLFDVVTENDEDSLILKKDTLQWHYFTYKKGYKYGLFFDSISSALPISLKADSVITKHIPDFSINYTEFNNSWIKIGENKSGNILECTYIIKPGVKDNNKDTSRMFLSNDFQDVNYTLSKTFDSVEKNKLFKTQMSLSEFYDSVSHFIVPKRLLFIEIGKLPIEEKEKVAIYNLIKRFDSMVKE